MRFARHIIRILEKRLSRKENRLCTHKYVIQTGIALPGMFVCSSMYAKEFQWLRLQRIPCRGVRESLRPRGSFRRDEYMGCVCVWWRSSVKRFFAVFLTVAQRIGPRNAFVRCVVYVFIRLLGAIESFKYYVIVSELCYALVSMT